jgi:hypothetical protein
MLGSVMDSIKAPSSNMTWTQLAAATVFVLVVAVGWRQITFYIMREM